jgi:hypothetical protein
VLARHAEEEFRNDISGRSPWWTCPGEKIDRLFVVLPQSRQTSRFDHLSQMRCLYRLALGQPHQQDFIETVAQLPRDGRHNFTLRLSAWKDQHDVLLQPKVAAVPAENAALAQADMLSSAKAAAPANS